MRRILLSLLTGLLLIGPALAQSITLDVAEAEAGVDAVTGAPSVNVTLTKDSREALAEFTTAHLGKVVEVVVNGNVLTAPTIRSPLVSGRFVISGNLVVGEADALAEAIGTPRAPLLLRVRKDKD